MGSWYCVRERRGWSSYGKEFQSKNEFVDCRQLSLCGVIS